MKRLIAILCVMLLVFSLAACGNDDDKKETKKTTAAVTTEAEGTSAAATDSDAVDVIITGAPETSTQAPDAVVPTDGTVEAWIAANQELIDTMCAAQSSTEEGITFTMSITAEGNDLYLIGTISGDVTDEFIEEAVTGADEEQEYFNSLTAEERAEELTGYVFDETMPVPDSVTTILCDEAGDVLASSLLEK